MGRPRKDEEALPERIEARRWKNGTTVTYRYLSPAGPKIYLGTDREQALVAYDKLLGKALARDLDPAVELSLERHRTSRVKPEAPLVRFHARATINAAGEPPYSHGNESVPTGFRTNENRHR